MGSRLEADLAEMGEWMHARGLKASSALSYATRFREFAAWYRETNGTGVTAGRVTSRVLEEYEGHLREKYQNDWARVASRISAVRGYNRWAVETGGVPRERRIVIKTISRPGPSAEKRRLSDEPYEGAQEWEEWLVGKGRRLSTVGAQRSVLRSIGRWCLERGLGKLRPAIVTPALLGEYWDSTGRSTYTRKQGAISVRNYIRWAMEAGLADQDPFAEVVREGHAGAGGAWQLVGDEDRVAFLAWVADESGTGLDAARRKVGGVTRFWRWFYFTRGATIRPEDATPNLLTAFERYLYQRDVPPKKRRLLSGSTINAYMHAARWFLRWAEQRHNEDEDLQPETVRPIGGEEQDA